MLIRFVLSLANLCAHLSAFANVSPAASSGNSSRWQSQKQWEEDIYAGAAKKENKWRLLLFFGHVSIRLLRRIKFIGAFFIYYQQAAGGGVPSLIILAAAGGGTAAIKRHTKTTISSAPSKAVSRSISLCLYIIYTNVQKQMIFAAIKPMELFHVCASVIFIGGAHHHLKSCFLLVLVMLAIAFLALFICQRAKEKRRNCWMCAPTIFAAWTHTFNKKISSEPLSFFLGFHETCNMTHIFALLAWHTRCLYRIT